MEADFAETKQSDLIQAIPTEKLFMKNLKLLSVILLVFSFKAHAISGREVWPKANMFHKVKLLKEYKAFFEKINLENELPEFKTRTTLFRYFLNDAWATEGMDCIYAGWPSKRVNNLCSSPARHNPDYKSSCGENEMQCQPLFFGKGQCVSVATKSQRSMAFSNCDKQKKKSDEEIINEIKADGKEADLLDLMDFADKICKEGKQKNTGMCRRLEAAVNRLRDFNVKKPETAPTIAVENNKNVTPRTVSREEREVVQTVVDANKIISRTVRPEDCEPETEGTPFEREEPRPIEWDYVTSKAGKDPAWEDTFMKDKNEQDLRPTGFEFRNLGENEIAGKPLDPTQTTEREWKFVSEDSSRRETYLWITDDAGSGFLSQRMDTIIMFVPRKMKPSIEAVGDELHVTLSTGEKVIYDKQTKLIKGGIIKEGKVDLNPDRFKRKFAPINYSGTGISIRVDKRGEDPRLIPGNATVTQNGKTCQVPARELWNSSSADFKYSQDQALVEFLNKKCKSKFSL